MLITARPATLGAPRLPVAPAPRPAAQAAPRAGGDAFVSDADTRAVRQAEDRLKLLIGAPRNATLPLLLEAGRVFDRPADRRAWLEAALHDHDLRASHVDPATARMMVARLTLTAIDRQLTAPEARTALGHIQALDTAHRLAETALDGIVEPDARRLAAFTNQAQRAIGTPGASLAVIQDGLRLLEHLPEDSPGDVSASIATLALGHMDKPGRTAAESEAVGLAALREIVELRGTPRLQVRLMEIERETRPARRLAMLREELGAEA